MRFRYPIQHRDTDSPGRIQRPFPTALFNLGAWLLPLSVVIVVLVGLIVPGDAVYLPPLVALLVLVPGLIFAQAYLGRRLGGGRAHKLAAAVAAAVLLALVITWVVWFAGELRRGS